MRRCLAAVSLAALAATFGCAGADHDDDAGFACGDITSDVRNCGACGHVCTVSDTGTPVCSDGTCAETYTLATDQTNPVDVAVNGQSVFWVNQGSEDANEDYNDDGALVSVPLAGGTPQTIASGEYNPTSVALDSTNVYWTNLGYREEGGAYDDQSGSVMKAALPAGTPMAISSELNDVGPLALAGENVLWISTLDFQVYSAPISGGSPSTFASGPAGGYVLLTTDTSNVYLASGVAIVKIPLTGGDPVTLSTAVSDTQGIAVDATNIYWTDYVEGGSGAVLQAPIAGGNTITLADQLEGPVGIAVDGKQVYWVDQWDGTVQRVPVGGGANVTLVSGQNEPLALALDATSVYWVTRESGTVMKLTPR